MSDRQFNFGENWDAFSRNALTGQRVAQAEQHFRQLLDGIELENRSFLDIGFGQGLGLLIARSLRARAVGCDINPICAEVLAANARRHFPQLNGGECPVIVGSILDEKVIEQVRRTAVTGEKAFDVVHSWGVLHHTGDMWSAIRNAASLVRPGGHLVIAIYARHWSSRMWKFVKWLYVHAPRFIQRTLIALFYPIIYAAKWMVTQRDPHQQKRGMDFYYDVIDWVGGYPYEFATTEELTREVEALGFTTSKVIPAQVPTGCNEFVFQRCIDRT
ncbi:MAG TPA: class I SAM-dependent methyltransferase [Chthoniobacterales bacterium]|nr:class I SAM-dependent methyltransferase [Chthoniobacterales bacterium]